MTPATLWMDDDPARLQRDIDEIREFAPELDYLQPSTTEAGQFHGGWRGTVEAWPFERSEPAGLMTLLRDSPLEFEIHYPAAYPMVPPIIYPISPAPELEQRSQHIWHVAPDGALCLLQSVGAWAPEESITEFIVKAAGWRIEYALMRYGAITEMTLSGIVSDPIHDTLIADTAAQIDADRKSHDTQ